MAEKMYFGVLENIQEIPAPKSGMGFASETDTEVTELVSGGRSVYRAPTAFKSFNMTWATTADRLRYLIALYNGQFGSGPFYLADPTAHQENVLPARWAAGWQLAHQAGGWCRPTVESFTTPLSPMPTRFQTNRYANFVQAVAGSSVPVEGVVKTRVIRIPGKPYYFMADAYATGGAGIKVRGYNGTTGVWTTLYTVTNFNSLYTVVAASNTTTTMIELDIYMPLGSTLQLYGMSLGTVDHSALQNVLRANRAINPSFESVSTSNSTVRTNYALNPSLEVDTTDWLGNAATISRITTENHSGVASLSVLTNGTSGSGAYKDAKAIAGSGWAVGDPCSASVWVKAPSGTAMMVSLVCLGGATGSAAVSFTGTGAWQKIDMTGGVVPSGATSVPYAYVRVNAVHTALTFYVDELLIEKSTVPGTYFDGATTAAGDFTYAWTGTANASTSIQRGLIPTYGVGGGGISSTEWALYGTKSVRTVPTTSSNDSWFAPEGDTGAMRYGFVGGKTYTVSATCRLVAAQTGTLNSTPRTIKFFYRVGTGSYQSFNSVAAPNTAGSTRLSVTGTLPVGTTEAFIRLQNGASIGNGDVWWDGLLVEESSTLDDYFDGSFADSHDQDKYYRWEGAANASRSVLMNQIPTDWMPVGTGIGPVNFSSSASGELVSSTIDRIGLSLDFVEVESVEG